MLSSCLSLPSLFNGIVGFQINRGCTQIYTFQSIRVHLRPSAVPGHPVNKRVYGQVRYPPVAGISIALESSSVLTPLYGLPSGSARPAPIKTVRSVGRQVRVKAQSR